MKLKRGPHAMDFVIQSKEQLKDLWTNIYNTEGKPDWSHILPYYDQAIYFCDSVQKINGIDDFKAMTERLIARSNNLKMDVKNTASNGNVLFMEWEMSLSFKKYPNSSVFGCSRVTLNDEGKIIEQRDYYDLWGDIFDNIPRFNKMYRKFMHKKFG
ncbi:SnoaL-like domain-containing protein [Sphaerochaeta associata]|jgi:limonene-1,2-epoxide hydrolase|nr:SnoaL-like domain-containing protein [Sphaerochaeta associata]